MTNNDNLIKFVIATAAGALGAYFHQLIFPILVLILAMVIDYFSGLAAAWMREELSSRTGVVGILKKLGYLAMVTVGCLIDYLIQSVSEFSPIPYNSYMVGLIVTAWLIINELISILENVARQGVPVPPFVGRILNHLKRTAEQAAPQVPEDPPEEVGKHERR